MLDIHFEIWDMPVEYHSKGKDDKGHYIGTIKSKDVRIMNGDKQIGRIFTPSGTGRNTPNAIQVCGFEDVFDLWGCGVFQDNKGNPKKDIQILFNKNSHSGTLKGFDFTDDCSKCFHPEKECKCYDLTIKNKKEILIKELEKK